ncbi:MAG: hypothetical protein R3190_13440, partial [Thermoanaerobaculia bacterium]|nr:hypothetical protein [Thermoanaerobaculia bacterium]
FARTLATHPEARATRVSGPAPAPLERLKGEWRFQVLLRHASSRRLRALVTDTLAAEGTGDVTVDVDPQDLF